ncbi:MAG: DUF3598 family protein [Rhodospirillaceae bacterium]|nr:DUF3598 family protein [Rhodospirillaceae bacterium]
MTDIDLRRRVTLGGLAAASVGINPAMAADDQPMTKAMVRAQLPVLARHEGVWEGTFRRYDPKGDKLAEFKARIVTRLYGDERMPKIYHQTNTYFLPDGKTQVIESPGEFRAGRLLFENERVKGWSTDDLTDPFKRTVFLYMEYVSDPGSYVYEMINISDDGRHRTRMTQFLKGGQTTMRTCIDETKVTDDWSKG